MYMLPFGSTFADVPDVGGSLTQWHVHRNLCLTNNPQQQIVAGLTSLNGGCPAGTSKAGDTPMLHVWIVPNQCGPFAALEGIGAGQVPAGQTRQCNTKYASVAINDPLRIRSTSDQAPDQQLMIAAAMFSATSTRDIAGMKFCW